MTTVKSIMDTTFSTISPNESVRNAMKLMLQTNSRTVLVTNHDELLGVFTEHDLVNRVFMESRFPSRTPVREVATLDPLALTEDSSIQEAAKRLLGNPYADLPVVDKEGRPTGLVSLNGLLPLLVKKVEEPVEKFQQSVSPSEAISHRHMEPFWEWG